MLWKEAAEFVGNRRFLRVFAIAVLLLGLLPTLEAHKGAATGAALLLDVIYVVLSGVIVVAQTAPDLVVRERSGRTLEYLLATRLPEAAIFGGKILIAATVGYLSAMLTVAVQLLSHGLLGGAWTWSFLALPQGRLIALVLPLVLAVYLSTVGTFVALRVGDQRSAYMVTMLSLVVLALPFLLRLVTIHVTMPWLWEALGVLAAVVAVLVVVGFRLLRREMLVLYLQE